MTFSINSQFSYKGARLIQTGTLIEHNLLRNTYTGALQHFYRNYKTRNDLERIDFASLTKLSPYEAACAYFSKTDCDSDINLYKELKITVQKTQDPLDISHIFYVISESYSDWIFYDIFDEIYLASGMKELIKNHGLKIKNNLEISHQTVGSLNGQFTGLFNEEFIASKKGKHAVCSQLSPAFAFKKIGFESIFFYAINLDFEKANRWAQLYELALSCGFIRINEIDAISRWAKARDFKRTLENAAGLHDDILFEYVKDQAREREINFVMTLTNHPPYDYPFKVAALKDININDPFDEQGNVLMPKEEIKDFLIKTFPEVKDKYLNEFCTIYWYDKVLTRFAKDILEKHPKSLIAITADHYGRFFPDEKTTLENTKTVPFIMLTKTAKLRPILENTNHLDIAATLINLIAPSGFSYPSFGKIAAVEDIKENEGIKYQKNNISAGYFIASNALWYYSPDQGIFYTLERGLNYKKDDAKSEIRNAAKSSLNTEVKSEISSEQKERDLKIAKVKVGQNSQNSQNSQDQNSQSQKQPKSLSQKDKASAKQAKISLSALLLLLAPFPNL